MAWMAWRRNSRTQFTFLAPKDKFKARHFEGQVLTDDRPLGCLVRKRGGMILVTKKAVSYQERRTFLENRARLTKNVLDSFEKRHAGLGHAGLRTFVGME